MIDNTNWSGYYENDSNSQYYPNSRYTVPYAFTYLGQFYRINVQVPVKSGTTATTMAALALLRIWQNWQKTLPLTLRVL